MGFRMSSQDRAAGTGAMSFMDPLDLSGAGARSSAESQREAAEKATQATIEAARIAAQATKDAQEAALKAQKEATAEAVAAAKEAEKKANAAIAEANVVYELAMQSGADFSNAQGEAAVKYIRGLYQDAYNKNTADFQRTYENIKKEYAQSYEDVSKQLNPWIETGTKANARLQDLAGLNGSEAGKNALQVDPGYKFRVEQGQQALERGAAGMGNLRSGNTGIALQEYGQGMAADEFTNVFNRLMSLSQQGQGSASALSGYRWNLGEKNAGNETNLTNSMVGARSDLTAKDAALEDYLAQLRSQNNWRVQDARGQNALNAANVAAQGGWNVANAQGGGAQNNANVAIAGANKMGDTNVNNAWAIQNALSNQAYGNAAADMYVNNAMKAGAWNALNTAASIYGGSKGGGGGRAQYQETQYPQNQNRSYYQPLEYGSGYARQQ